MIKNKKAWMKLLDEFAKLNFFIKKLYLSKAHSIKLKKLNLLINYILHCKNCKKKFSIIEEESYIIGKIVKEEVQRHSGDIIYLENRLAELTEDLDKTERN